LILGAGLSSSSQDAPIANKGEVFKGKRNTTARNYKETALMYRDYGKLR
jgi:hypothetical protein